MNVKMQNIKSIYFKTTFWKYDIFQNSQKIVNLKQNDLK